MKFYHFQINIGSLHIFIYPFWWEFPKLETILLSMGPFVLHKKLDPRA